MNEIRFTNKSLQHFLKEASKYPPLHPDAEATATPEQLIKHNMLFVVSEAKKINNSATDIKDLISEGMIGLIKAANRFDSTRGFKFISFAVYYIRQAILTYIYDTQSTIRIPAKNYQLIRTYLELKAKYDEAEIKEMDLFPKYFIRDFHHYPKVMSIENDSNDEDEIEKQFASDEDTARVIENLSMSKKIKIILRTLSKEEYFIIENMYLVDFPLRPFQIAERLNYSQERIRQLHLQALHKLRQKTSVHDLLTQ
jgi:RNA polymerase primary sigma factor